MRFKMYQLYMHLIEKIIMIFTLNKSLSLLFTGLFKEIAFCFFFAAISQSLLREGSILLTLQDKSHLYLTFIGSR